MSLKQSLGKGWWEYVVAAVSTTGVDAIWSNPNATIEELEAAKSEDALPGEFDGVEGYWAWSEFRKVGRSIRFVEVRRL